MPRLYILIKMSEPNNQDESIPQILIKSFDNHTKPTLDTNQNMSPQSLIKSISMIFADHPQPNIPHFSSQARIILLTIILCASVLAMYSIYESFIDTIILAFLSGVAYVRLRDQFVYFCRSSKAQENGKKSTLEIIVSSLVNIGLIVIIPWIHNEFLDDTVYHSWFELFHAKINCQTPYRIFNLLLKSNNIIKLTQIYLVLRILFNLFGNGLKRIYVNIKQFFGNILISYSNKRHQNKLQMKERIEHLLHLIFAITCFLSICLALIIFACLLFEFSSVLNSAGKAVEKYHNCSFFSLDNNTNHLEQCTDVITGSLKPYLPRIENKTQIAKCMGKIAHTEQSYLNISLFQHKKQICIVYQILKEQSPQVIDHFFNIEVTTEYLATILKNVFRLISLTSDTIFSLTTFISIFMVTLKSYSAAQQNFNLFGQHQNQLFTQITNLIYDYTMVTFKHLVFSFALFQIFRFSEINIILSFLIGTITLFPLLSVTFIMVIFTALKYYLARQSNYLGNLSSIICLTVFYVGSSQIFKNHFNKIDFNKALISLSAVFGLYKFGLAGIFYGPIVILLFRCTYEALGKIQ